MEIDRERERAGRFILHVNKRCYYEYISKIHNINLLARREITFIFSNFVAIKKSMFQFNKFFFKKTNLFSFISCD